MKYVEKVNSEAEFRIRCYKLEKDLEECKHINSNEFIDEANEVLKYSDNSFAKGNAFYIC